MKQYWKFHSNCPFTLITYSYEYFNTLSIWKVVFPAGGIGFPILYHSDTPVRGKLTSRRVAQLQGRQWQQRGLPELLVPRRKPSWRSELRKITNFLQVDCIFVKFALPQTPSFSKHCDHCRGLPRIRFLHFLQQHTLQSLLHIQQDFV